MGAERWEDQCERKKIALVPWRVHLHYAPCRPDRRHLGAFKLYIFFPSPCLCLQGSVVVFSNYAWWTYTDTTSPTYCAHTPMLFAFVLLLVSLTSSLLEVRFCVHVLQPLKSASLSVELQVKWLLIPALCLTGCISALCCPNENEEQEIEN